MHEVSRGAEEESPTLARLPDGTHTFGMTVTTIKVPSDLRDGLKEQAHAEGRTLGDHLRFLMEQEERRRRFAAVREAMRRNPPDEEYRADLGDWQSDAWT